VRDLTGPCRLGLAPQSCGRPQNGGGRVESNVVKGMDGIKTTNFLQTSFMDEP